MEPMKQLRLKLRPLVLVSSSTMVPRGRRARQGSKDGGHGGLCDLLSKREGEILYDGKLNTKQGLHVDTGSGWGSDEMLEKLPL